MAPPKPMDRKFLHRILITAFATLLLLFVPILCRLYFLQAVRHEYYTAKAKSLHAKTVKVTPQRGSVYSAQGQLLATSAVRESAYLAPRYLGDDERLRRRLAYRLSNCLSIPVQGVEQKLRSKHDTILKRKLPPEEVEELLSLREELDLPVPSLYFVREGNRLYPKGALASHVIGYTKPDDYGDNIGMAGIEHYYNKAIAGSFAQDKVEVNVFRQDLTPLEDETLLKAAGHDIYLTINETLQQHTEDALSSTVSQFKAAGGVCVVMEVATGAVLAMASNPTFNLNEKGLATPASRKNRCLVDPISPGSVMKVFTSTALIDLNKMSPHEMIDCHGGRIYYPGRKKPIVDSHSLGVVPVHTAFAESSNVAYTLLGLRLEKEEFYDYLRRFNFGRPTGIDLPGEGGGILYNVDRWTLQSRISIPIGYELIVTPIQVAAAMAAIANQGVYMRPHILKEIRSQKGELIHRYEPKAVNRVCSPQTAEIVLSMMGEVVTSGTGSLAFVPGYRVGGKTGTTVKDRVQGEPETGRRRYYASFLGVFPLDNPRVVVYAWVDEPNVRWGGSVSAPLVGMVGESALRTLNVAPTEKIVPKKSDLRRMAKKQDAPAGLPRVLVPALPAPVDLGVIMPDYTGQTVREVLASLHRLKIDAQLTGSGVAVQQHPAPGMPLAGNTRGLIVFAPPLEARNLRATTGTAVALSNAGARVVADAPMLALPGPLGLIPKPLEEQGTSALHQSP